MSATTTITTAATNNTSENKSDGIRKKASFRRQGSYRVFRVSNRRNDDEESDENNAIEQAAVKTTDKLQKKSFRSTNRDGWKQKSSKGKRLLFLHKSSCESPSIEPKTPLSISPSVVLLPESSPSGVSNDPTADTQLLKPNKRHRHQEDVADWSDSDALAGAIDDTVTNDDATLNDLLARADKLEATVKKQDFVKIRPGGHASFHRKRKRFIIACGGVLIALSIIITIIVFVVVMTVKHKTQMEHLSASTPIRDPFR